ncbi:MAG: 3-methyladenine DNA glycosylase [Bdellovibrionota bacterium]
MSSAVEALVQSANRTLTLEEWQHAQRVHTSIIVPFTMNFRTRRAKGKLHPIYDFLFSYYTYSTKKLEKWHPGFGTKLEGPKVSFGDGLLDEYGYVYADGALTLSAAAIRTKDIKQLLWVRSLCEAMLNRPERFSCFGLHEWAIVYREAEIRHQYPLRLSASAVAEVVESNTLCCSHFDAFRFFAPAARGLNVLQPTSDTRLHYEQSGCLHANMDLYKWAYKLMPWTSSDLLRECFLLALRAREIDMRASPYDFRSLGFAPILIETAEGKKEYREAQQEIAASARPLRQRMLDLTNKVLASAPQPQVAAVRDSFVVALPAL